MSVYLCIAGTSAKIYSILLVTISQCFIWVAFCLSTLSVMSFHINWHTLRQHFGCIWDMSLSSVCTTIWRHVGQCVFKTTDRAGYKQYFHMRTHLQVQVFSKFLCKNQYAATATHSSFGLLSRYLFVSITIYPYLILLHYLHLILLANMQKHLDYAIPFSMISSRTSFPITESYVVQSQYGLLHYANLIHWTGPVISFKVIMV